MHFAIIRISLSTWHHMGSFIFSIFILFSFFSPVSVSLFRLVASICDIQVKLWNKSDDSNFIFMIWNTSHTAVHSDLGNHLSNYTTARYILLVASVKFFQVGTYQFTPFCLCYATPHLQGAYCVQAWKFNIFGRISTCRNFHAHILQIEINYLLVLIFLCKKQKEKKKNSPGVLSFQQILLSGPSCGLRNKFRITLAASFLAFADNHLSSSNLPLMGLKLSSHV